jgi:thiamine pyrophosphate-dependent acetolactate synthase large subunit-like protein
MTEPTMDVRDAVAALHEHRGNAIVVMTMSAIAFWPEVGEWDFRLVGTMGAAASIGLGLALGVPDRPVWVIDGDGSLLMQLAVTAAIGAAAPPNFVHIVIDNGMYAVSGGQPTPGPRDWAGLLVAAGYAAATGCDTPAAIDTAIGRADPGPRAIIAHCRRERPAYAPGWLAVRAAGEAARLRRALARDTVTPVRRPSPPGAAADAG